MKPAPFAYHRPASLPEAAALLARHGDGAKAIAGGVSLVPIMNMRLARPAHLIDIGRLPGLRGVRREGDSPRIGALTPHADVVTNPLIRAHAPLLAAAGPHIGHAAIRNRGTIGGSLAHADPAAEWPVALSASGSAVRAVSAAGERAIPLDAFFITYFTTALRPDEILTEITVPVAAAATHRAFVEFSRRPGDFAIVSVACWLAVADGNIRQARLALGDCCTIRL